MKCKKNQNIFSKSLNKGCFVSFSEIKADVITFGFPCQDLSLAGKRRGLSGERSGLFFEAIRIIREVRPAYFIFENVAGLLTSHGGADFIRCLREIADIGLYECEWQLVNTNWFLPQRRERVFFVGRFGGVARQPIFPIPTKTEGNRKFEKKVISFNGKPLYIPENTRKGYAEVFAGQAFDFHYSNSKTRRGRLMKDECHTLTTQPKYYFFYNGKRIRSFTPIECERMQGFPDDWTKYGADGQLISDTARYKAIGNAVTTVFPYLIGQQIKELK